MDDLTLKIDTGALVEVPAFEPDECGHNWLAVIEDRDPRAPVGLRRRFQPRVGVPFYYLVEGFEVGDVIEFGADRVSLKPSASTASSRKGFMGSFGKSTPSYSATRSSRTPLQRLRFPYLRRLGSRGTGPRGRW